MSLPTATSPCVNANTGANAETPAAPTATQPAPEEERGAGSPANRIAMHSRKRPRNDDDAMQVGGVDSDDSSVDSPSQDDSADEESTEPVVKRRRLGNEPDHKAQIRAVREQISTALQRGDLRQLEALLDQHPGCLDVKHPVTKATPLLEAVWWGQVELVCWLLGRGANASAECEGFYAYELTNDDLPEGPSEALRTHATTQLMAAPGNQTGEKESDDWEGHVLWHSPLAHAAGHRVHAILRLLLDKGAKPTSAALSASIVARDPIGMQALLAAGAKPDHYPHAGPFENTTSFVCAISVDSGWEALLAHMVKTLSAEKLAEELRNALDYCIDEISLPLLQRLLIAGLAQLVQRVQTVQTVKGQDAPDKHWLVEVALSKGNGRAACFLLQQGYAYTFETDADVQLAARGCRDQQSFVYLQQRMPTPQLKQHFLDWCLCKSLLLYFDTFVRHKPGDEFKRWLVGQGASPSFVSGSDTSHDDLAFHLAARTGDHVVVQAFFDRFPGQDFHLPGVAGLYPVELAVMRRESAMLQLLMSHIVADEQFFAGLYEHAVTQARNQRLGDELLSGRMLKFSDTARYTVFVKACNALDWKSIEYMFTFDAAKLADWFRIVKTSFPEPKRTQLDSFLRQADLLHRPRRVLDTPAWQASANAGQLLEHIGMEATKDGTAFGEGVAGRLEASGLTGEIGATLQLLWERYSYVRAAIIDVDRDAAVAGQQFASFVGYWLPATPVWESWLKPSMVKNGDKDVSLPLAYALTHRIVAQVKDLREGGKSRTIAWATQVVAQLPLLCVSCVDAETERVDIEKAAPALQRLGVLMPNTKRLAFALQCAYAKVVSATAAASSSGMSGTPAQLYRGFAGQLLAEIRQVLAASADDDDKAQARQAVALDTLAQREVADALVRLSQQDYQRQHGDGKALTPQFMLDAIQLLSEMVWWQMDALLKHFGLALDGQANLLEREMKPFDQFVQALPGHAEMLDDQRFEY